MAQMVAIVAQNKRFRQRLRKFEFFVLIKLVLCVFLRDSQDLLHDLIELFL